MDTIRRETLDSIRRIDQDIAYNKVNSGDRWMRPRQDGSIPVVRDQVQISREASAPGAGNVPSGLANGLLQNFGQ